MFILIHLVNPVRTYPISEKPAEAAKQLRIKWELGDRPIKNMLHLLELHGFQVEAINSPSEKVDAFGSQTKVNGKNYYCILIDQDNNSFFVNNLVWHMN